MASVTVNFQPLPGRSFSITGNERDAGVIGEIARSGGLYQRDVVGLLRRLLGPDAVVVDGGAHIGVLSVLMASLAPAGRVFAFEPAPETHGHLLGNLAANGITNVTAVAAALSDTDGTLTLTFNEDNPGGSHLAADGRTQVQASRLDTWAAAQGLTRLDLLKLDVEGSELAALDGAAGTVGHFRPTLIVECNPIALGRFARRSWRDLLDRLHSLYPVVALVGRRGTLVPIRSSGHLELALGEHGVVDLVATGKGSTLARSAGSVRAVLHHGRLLAAHNRRRPPNRNFVVEPGVRLTVETASLTGAPAETISVPVRVANHGTWWLSSAFYDSTVHASYRWLDRAGAVVVPEGHRTPFPTPLGPGAETGLDLIVQLPTEPGEYLLKVTLLQEQFAWLDEVDPACAALVPASVG